MTQSRWANGKKKEKQIEKVEKNGDQNIADDDVGDNKNEIKWNRVTNKFEEKLESLNVCDVREWCSALVVG